MRISSILFVLAGLNTVFGTVLTLGWAYGILVPKVENIMHGWLCIHGCVVMCLYAAAGVTRGEGK